MAGRSHSANRDADLLGYGDLDADTLARTFAEICAVEVEADALVFDAASIRVSAIRKEDAYGGQRVTLLAKLGPARIRVQVDVGIGDDVVPEPEWLVYPSLLDLPRPRLRAYQPETAIAEKVHAMAVLGSNNSRMRDFFDVYALAMHERFDGERLAVALRATFVRRHTPISSQPMLALTARFAQLEGKGAQWTRFLRRNRIASVPFELSTVIASIAEFIFPALIAARDGKACRDLDDPEKERDLRHLGERLSDGVVHAQRSHMWQRVRPTRTRRARERMRLQQEKASKRGHGKTDTRCGRGVPPTSLPESRVAA